MFAYPLTASGISINFGNTSTKSFFLMNSLTLPLWLFTSSRTSCGIRNLNSPPYLVASLYLLIKSKESMLARQINSDVLETITGLSSADTFFDSIQYHVTNHLINNFATPAGLNQRG